MPTFAYIARFKWMFPESLVFLQRSKDSGAESIA